MPQRSDLLGTVMIAALFGVLASALWFGVVASPPPEPPDPETLGRLVSSMYDPPANAIEASLVKGDGQIFAGQSTDPLVRRPEMVRGAPSEQAYRYQRPIYGWLGWAMSAGRPQAVAVALMGVTVLSVVLLAVVALLWCTASGVDPRFALLVLLVPGVLINLTWIGPETLGTALAALGLLLVSTRAGPTVPLAAVACFAAAGLCRETLLLVPFVLMLVEARRGHLRRAAAAAASAVPYVAWVLFLRIRIGAWPVGKQDERLSAVPFGGWFDAVGRWGPEEWVVSVAMLALAIAALVRGRRSGLRPYVVAHLLLAASFGYQVCGRIEDFSRILLPLNVLSLLALIASTKRSTFRTST